MRPTTARPKYDGITRHGLDAAEERTTIYNRRRQVNDTKSRVIVQKNPARYVGEFPLVTIHIREGYPFTTKLVSKIEDILLEFPASGKDQK